jgi:hypothetical protein
MNKLYTDTANNNGIGGAIACYTALLHLIYIAVGYNLKSTNKFMIECNNRLFLQGAKTKRNLCIFNQIIHITSVLQKTPYLWKSYELNRIPLNQILRPIFKNHFRRIHLSNSFGSYV